MYKDFLEDFLSKHIPVPLLKFTMPKKPSFDGNVGKNTNSGFGSMLGAVSPWLAAALFVGSGLVDGLTSTQKEDELISQSGVGTGYGNGFTYQKQNFIDSDKFMENYDKLTIGSIFSNPITALGRVFTRGDQEQEIKKANRKIQLANDIARSVGATDYATTNYYMKNGDTTSQVLYGAKNGKDSINMFDMDFLPPTAKLEGNEVLYNSKKGSATIVPGPQNGDKNLAHVEPDDTVITNKFGLSKVARPFASALEKMNKNTNKFRGSIGKTTDSLTSRLATQALDEIANTLKYLRYTGLLDQPKLTKAKFGKDSVPGFKVGWNGLNNWVGGLGMAASLGQYLDASLQNLHSPNIYSVNPHEKQALSILAKNRIDTVPIFDKIYDQFAQAAYKTKVAGGLTPAQKAGANVAQNIAAIRSIGDAAANAQMQQNKYNSDFAMTAMNAGQAERSARMAANQYKEEAYRAAHNARQLGKQTAVANMFGQLRDWVGNRFGLDQFLRTLNLYSEDLALRKEASKDKDR